MKITDKDSMKPWNEGVTLTWNHYHTLPKHQVNQQQAAFDAAQLNVIVL